MAKKKAPDIQDRLRRLIAVENRLLKREANREREIEVLVLEFRDLLKRAETADKAGERAKADRLYAQAKRKAEDWRAMQGERIHS